MIRQSRIAAAAVILALGATARAQTPEALAGQYVDTAAGITVDQAVERALRTEPSLRATRTEVDRAKGVRLQAGLRPNPSASFMDQVEPGGTDSQRRVEVMWPLDLFRRTGRLAVASGELSAIEFAVADWERLLAAEVRAAYGDAVASIRDLAVHDELVQSTSREHALLASRVAEGGTPALERDVVDVELRRLRAERLLLAGRIDRKVIELKRLLGMQAAEPLALGETIEQLVAGGAARPAANTPVAGALARTDVREAEARVGAAEAGIEQSRRNGRFDVNLVGAYTRMDAGFPQLGLSRSGEPARVRGLFHYLSAGVSVSLPLLNRNQGAIAAAQADKTGAVEQLSAARLDAEAETAAAQARDERARSALAIYQDDGRALARRNLEVVTQTYELGRATIFDVLAEQRRYLDFERAYSATLREAYEAGVALRRAVGDVR